MCAKYYVNAFDCVDTVHCGTHSEQREFQSISLYYLETPIYSNTH